MKVVNKIQKESRMNPVYKIIKGVAAGVAIVAGLSVLGYCYHNHCDPKILIKTGCNGIIQQFPKYKIVTDLENGLVGTYHDKEYDKISQHKVEYDLTQSYISVDDVNKLEDAVYNLEKVRKCIEGK